MIRFALATAIALAPVSAFAQIAHQFTLVGPIEAFTVDDMTDPLSPAKLTVHGVEAVLPANLIIQMPARYLTAKDIVDLNPLAPGVNSGLAVADSPAPLASYEATVVGNIVGQTYVAGLVWISQHSLATGAGFIRAIAPDGEIQVVADPSPGAPAQPVARVRINDPDGVYAPADPNADERFMVDEANPTIHAGTGYPMCVPQAALPAECPAANRPLGADGMPLTTFVMGATGLPAPLPGRFPSRPARHATRPGRRR